MHWKRLVEFSAPLWLAAAGWCACDRTWTSDFTWEALTSLRYPLWILVASAIFWIATAFVLRPLTLERSPRRRFGLVAAMVVSLVLWTIALHRFVWGTHEGWFNDEVVFALAAPLMLLWGVYQSLSDTRPASTACAVCGYDLVGLSARAPCPECGRARSM
jgi:hypothetical protein